MSETIKQVTRKVVEDATSKVVAVFDPYQIVITFGDIVMDGFADGSFITNEPSPEAAPVTTPETT